METRGRRPLAGLACVCLALSAGLWTVKTFGQDSSHDGDQTQIVALENGWNQAELHNDPAALKLILTDDFVITEPDGELLNKEQLMESVADRSYHYEHLVSQGYRVRVHGTVALVTGIYHEKGSANGKHFDRSGRFTDTWLKFGTSWQCVASHDSLIKK